MDKELYEKLRQKALEIIARRDADPPEEVAEPEVVNEQLLEEMRRKGRAIIARRPPKQLHVQAETVTIDAAQIILNVDNLVQKVRVNPEIALSLSPNITVEVPTPPPPAKKVRKAKKAEDGSWIIEEEEADGSQSEDQ